MTTGGRTKHASGLASDGRRFFLTGQARFGDDQGTASPAEDGRHMSDLNAIQRIIDACEGQPNGSPTPFDAPGDVTEAAVSRAMEVINHLLGPSPGLPVTNFVGRDGSDLIIAPALLASMLRAARGEPVTVGRLVFVGHTVLRRRVAEIADMLRCSTWRRVDEVHKKLVDLVATWEAP